MADDRIKEGSITLALFFFKCCSHYGNFATFS